MSAERIEIRKYPNRRYYNTRDSRHVTLEEIRDLVREGHEIKVVDSRTEEDITVTVLTQILLEIESPKLAFFPASFLQHLIRVNTDVFKNMTESYFKNSMASFVKAAESTQDGATAGFGVPFSGSFDEWQKVWMGMFSKAPEPGPAAAKAEKPPASKPKETTDQVAALSKQMEEMQRALNDLRRGREK